MANRFGGQFDFNGNFEPSIAAALDARLVVETKSQLTAFFGMPYKGMIVTVTDDSTADDNGVYVLVGSDTSVAANWEKLGEGGTTFDGDYTSLTNTPSLFDGNYDSLTNKPSLFDGNYDSLTNKPSLFDGNYTSLSGAPTSTYSPPSGAVTLTDVGSIDAGSLSSSLDGLSFNDLFNMIFFPVVSPTISPSTPGLAVTVKENNSSIIGDVFTVGDTIVSLVVDGSVTDSRFQINNQNNTNQTAPAQGSITNVEITLSNITYDKDSGTATQFSGTSSISNYTISNYTVTEGENKVTMKVSYAASQVSGLNSHGNTADPVVQLGAKTKTTSKSFYGSYPIFQKNSGGTYDQHSTLYKITDEGFEFNLSFPETDSNRHGFELPKVLHDNHSGNQWNIQEPNLSDVFADQDTNWVITTTGVSRSINGSDVDYVRYVRNSIGKVTGQTGTRYKFLRA